MKHAITVARVAIWVSAAAALWAQSGNADSGKKLYEAKTCYQCHGWQGQGGLNGARLAQTKLTLDGFRNVLRNPPPGNMPPFRAALLSDAEIADLYAYIRSFPEPKPASEIPMLKD